MKTALLVLMTFVSINASAGDYYYPAFSLAIQNFNADASKDMKAWTPEHTLMMAALETVATTYPQLANATMQELIPESFYALEVQTFVYPDADDFQSQTDFTNIIKQKTQDLVTGCGYRKKTTVEEQNLGFTKPSENVTTEIEYSFDGKGNMKCANSVTAELAKAGINQVIVREEKRGFLNSVEYSVKFRNQMNSPRDMRYVKKQIAKIKGIDAELVEALQPIVSQGIIGYSSDIKLVETSGQATMADSFVLEYYQGSGDCPAGCIEKIYTKVKVTPVSEKAVTVEIIGTTKNGF